MSNRRSIFLLVLVILASVAANLALDKRAPAPVQSRKARELVDPSLEISSIEIRRAGMKAMKLVGGASWIMTAPYAANVDQTAVRRFVDVLLDARVSDSRSDEELVSLGQSRAVFGVDDPVLELVLGTDEGALVYRFGEASATTNDVYVTEGDGDSVMTIPASVFRALDVCPESFRERGVLPVVAESVDQIEIRRPQKQVMTIRRDGEEWKSGERVVSAQSVNEVLERFISASAIDFFWPTGATNEAQGVSASELSGYGLDVERALVCSFVCRGGAEYRILLGSVEKDDRVYALVQNGSAVVSLPLELRNLIAEDSKLVSDPRLLPYDPAAVNSFTLADAALSCVVARDEGGRWRLDAPVSAPADSEVAARFLERLLALTPADAEKSGLRVSVNTNSAQFVVKPSAVLGEDRLEMLRSREIVRIDPKLVKRLVSVSEKGASVSVAYSQDRASWHCEGEAGAEAVDAEAVAGVLAALNPLMAVRVEALQVTPEMLPRFGLEHPHFTLAVDQLQEGSVRRNLLVGGKTKGGRFATVGSADAVFVISEEVFGGLSRSFIEK